MNINRQFLLDLDTALCIKINNLSGKRFIDKLFYIVSRLGDGAFYFLILALFIYFFNKSPLLMMRDYFTAAGINGLIYKITKTKIKRIRPFIAIESINKLMPPPDEFSFPSGHSSGAAVFFYCTLINMPLILAIMALIWMLLIGFSRVYNGVHYPGDVLVGYLMGITISKITIYTYSIIF